MIVTVTPTVMDGTVVRWYFDQTPLDALPAHQPAVSASRNGVLVHGYLDAIGDEVLAAAKDVQQTLARNRYADVQHMATHRQRGLFGPYEPVSTPTATTDSPPARPDGPPSPPKPPRLPRRFA